MKFAMLFCLTLMSVTVMAADRCYVARNAGTMKVEITPEGAEVSTIESVSKASLKLYASEGTRFADLNVVTNSGKHVNVGALYTSGDKHPAPGVRTYYVECDGGSMDVVKADDGTLILHSDRIRGDIEGCDGIAEVKLDDTEFLGVSCSK